MTHPTIHYTLPISTGEDICLICGSPTTQYFGANANLPLCGNLACETKLIDEINKQFNEAAQDAAEYKGE